ncbi:hypothetical protein [Priestia aryabhattai]|nr:hypothetical protein [Priestia aryabhattai]
MTKTIGKNKEQPLIKGCSLFDKFFLVSLTRTKFIPDKSVMPNRI